MGSNDTVAVAFETENADDVFYLIEVLQSKMRECVRLRERARVCVK